MADTTFLIAVALLVGGLAAAYFVFASFAFGAGYEPTPRRTVEQMLRFAEVGPQDTVYDLGAGTGAIVFRAARTYRAHVVGVEVEPIRVLILRIRRRLGPFADRIEIHWGDFFRLDFRRATVVTAFLWPGAMTRLRAKFESELPFGARIVSHCHPVPGWTPERYDRPTDVYLYRWTGRPEGPGTAAMGGG
jgi:SAM-dependent methyltransferase